MYHHETPPVNSTPMLGGVVEAACNLLDCRDTVSDHKLFMADLGVQQRHYAAFMAAACEHLQALIQDLMEVNADLERSNRAMRHMHREHTRLRLPAWFWRDDDRELKYQLFDRARLLLYELRAPTDDTYEVLREYVDEIVRPAQPVTDDQIVGVVEYAAQRGA